MAAKRGAPRGSTKKNELPEERVEDDFSYWREEGDDGLFFYVPGVFAVQGEISESGKSRIIASTGMQSLDEDHPTGRALRANLVLTTTLDVPKARSTRRAMRGSRGEPK